MAEELDPRLARLEKGPLKTEADTVRAMVHLYCTAHHKNGEKKDNGLCPECETLLSYAMKRLACCPFGENKAACGNCKVHCYKPEMLEKIAVVMRYAGPRLLWRHPVLSLAHIIKSLTVKAPEKPRNKAVKKA